MNDAIKNYERIGFLKNMIICLYDLLLLFSVLFFMSLPWIIFYQGEAVIGNVLYQLYLLVIILSYYLWFWVKQGQTLGMKSWKTYLLTPDNETITIKQGLVRIVVSLLGGHLLLIINNKSLQDIVTKTHIIRVKR